MVIRDAKLQLHWKLDVNGQTQKHKTTNLRKSCKTN